MATSILYMFIVHTQGILAKSKVFGFQKILWNVLSYIYLKIDLFKIVRDVKVEFYKLIEPLEDNLW